MGSLNSLYFKKSTLETLLKTVESKNENGVAITVSINDDSNEWGQNISAFVEQTKEQREAKKDRFYVGNGKTFWTDGTIKVAERKEQPVAAPVAASVSEDGEELPF